jgi:hypothetical protein
MSLALASTIGSPHTVWSCWVSCGREPLTGWPTAAASTGNSEADPSATVSSPPFSRASTSVGQPPLRARHGSASVSPIHCAGRQSSRPRASCPGRLASNAVSSAARRASPAGGVATLA